jgi:hypothetical protein
MAVTPPSPEKTTQGGGTSFVGFLAAGLVWLVVGVLVGRYLFPEKVEKIVTQTVDRVVTQRVEVPVEKIVLKEVVKEVEKIVEVPVEKVVIKEISVPVPMKAAKEKPTPEAEPSPWDFIRNGMTKSDVAALLGNPASTREEAEKILWFYEERGQGVIFVRFHRGGLFGADKVDQWLGPDRRPVPKANAGAKLLEMAREALADGNAALALVYAQSALVVEPNSAPIKELIRELLAKISAQTPPR